MSINKRLSKLQETLSSGLLMNQERRGGELGFYIFDYAPKDENQIRDFVQSFISTYDWDDPKIKPVECDLYFMTLNILESERIQNKSILELLPDMELKNGTERLERALKSVLSPKNFLDLIEKMAENRNLILITGVGKVFPLIRSHIILNNLQNVIDRTPVILFYPGTYDERELRLFNLFKDDNYYRAFRIAEDELDI